MRLTYCARCSPTGCQKCPEPNRAYPDLGGWASSPPTPPQCSSPTALPPVTGSDLTGGLAIDLKDAGQAVLQLANPHGDIVATTTLGQPGINTCTETDEHGQLRNSSAQHQ